MTPTSRKGFSAAAGTCGDQCLPIYAVRTRARECGARDRQVSPQTPASPQSDAAVAEVLAMFSGAVMVCAGCGGSGWRADGPRAERCVTCGRRSPCSAERPYTECLG